MRWSLGAVRDVSGGVHVVAAALDGQAAQVRGIWSARSPHLCARMSGQRSEERLCLDCVLRLSSLLLVSRMVRDGRIEVGEEVRDGKEDTAVPVQDRWSA